jgi:hypothetical protein
VPCFLRRGKQKSIDGSRHEYTVGAHMRRATTTDDEVGFASSPVMAGQKLVFVRRPPSCVCQQTWRCCGGRVAQRVVLLLQLAGGATDRLIASRLIRSRASHLVRGSRPCSHQPGRTTPSRMCSAAHGNTTHLSSCVARHTTPH